MKAILFGITVLFFHFSIAQNQTDINANKIVLPNGWTLTPFGKSIQLGDLPLNIAVSKNKNYIAVTNNGQSTQSIQLIDVKTERLLGEIKVAKSWYGLKFYNNNTLYASGGNDNRILQFTIADDKLTLTDSISLGKKYPNKISPTGLDIDENSNQLFVTTKENNTFYVVDLNTKKVIDSIPLESEGYTCLLSKDKTTVYISLWGGGKILFYDVALHKIINEINVGDHPNEMCLSKNGKYLFVANANDNSVSVIDVNSKKTIETLNAALYPNSPSGSTSNSVVLSEDNKTLYVANADNNCLAVFDVSTPGQSVSKGFIPVGWYPTNVKVVRGKIFVANGKGFSSLPNPNGPNPYREKQSVNYQKADTNKPKELQYIGGLFKGTMSIFGEPSKNELALYSKQVYANTPYTKEKELNAEGEIGNPVPSKVGDASPIKHLFYIIKENRTYDQVLSDVRGGNGDTSLLLFGEKYTPNLHALANQFVLLDNFYCDAEVSADGHNWSMGAYATDYLEKTWPTSYGGRGGGYDGEGNRAIANNKDGFIWDLCFRNKVSFRTYGEFAESYNGITKENIPVLKNHTCPYYTGWNTAVRDTSRFYQWKREFDSLVAIDDVPQLSTMRFGNDHTEGLKKGAPTPYAHVADNDLAVGMFIEYLSHSKIWKESAVFIVEDDAQNGPDHVDAHRTTAYVVSPFVKRKFIDHSMYSTTSMLRTIELILGMPPMTQYDAAAKPMWQCFTSHSNVESYIHLPANIDLNEKNVGKSKASAMSDKLDFSKEDNIPDLVFNEILWQGLKGKPAPAPSRAAFVQITKKKKDKDD